MKLRNKKTGEISTKIDVSQDNKSIWVFSKCPRIYCSLAELNEEWEDYEPKEPLIKDKEVRNIVRLWAKYHNADILQYRELSGCVGHYLKAGLRSIDIDIDSLKLGMFYTIEELCGEEEE